MGLWSLFLSACGEETPLLGAHGSLQAEASAVDFGSVFMGSEVRRTFRLFARGALGVDYSSRFEGDAYGYAAGPAVGRIDPNGAAEIVVIFRPGRPGLARARLIFESSGTDASTAAVELSANGVVPPDCEDGNGCTTDRFDSVLGRCEHQAADLACDDLNECTTADSCLEGLCRGSSRSCDDDNPCTDDLCDRVRGCVNAPTHRCDDQNPCTVDTCSAEGGCESRELDDGTPCDDVKPCTTADICLSGHCIGVNVPEGTRCDDGDPCSKDDQCLTGTCRDPSYRRPLPGEIKFDVTVGNLAAGAASNPLVDRDGTVFVGLEQGVVAVGQCGDIRWANRELGTPRWSAAVSLPGSVSVPLGARIIHLETAHGTEIGREELSSLFAASSSTATATVSVLDLAARASGVLVASVVRTDSRGRIEGLIAEIDPTSHVATVFRRLGQTHAARLAVDEDESIVAVIADGPPDRTPRRERVLRIGVTDEGTWATTATISSRTELGLGTNGEIFWTHGLLRLSRDGRLKRFAPQQNLVRATGSPLALDERMIWVRAGVGEPVFGFGALPFVGFDLVAMGPAGELLWSAALPGSGEGMSPAADAAGNVLVTSFDGHLYAFDPDGHQILDLDLALDAARLEPQTVTLTFDRVAIVPGPDRVIGVQWVAPLAASAWPRHRRDNLGSGHR